MTSFVLKIIAVICMLFDHVGDVLIVDFSYFNSSLIKCMTNMFFGWSTLESINFMNFDTLQVSNMANMFFNCMSLEDLNISDFNTYNIITRILHIISPV